MTDTIYGDLAGAASYHAARGNTDWTGEDAALTTALLRGTEFVDQLFRTRFPGSKVGGRAQQREWPRNSAWDADGYSLPSDEVPDEVIAASYEAALRELLIPGSLRPDYVPSERVKSQTVVGAVSREFFGTSEGGAAAVATMVPIIGAILAPVLTGGAGNASALSGRAYRV